MRRLRVEQTLLSASKTHADRSVCSTSALALATLVAILLPPTLPAAPPTTAITGRVMSAGAPAGGVTVTATSTALQGERTTVTMADGRYWLTALPPGRYDVTFSRKGLQTLTKRALVELARIARADAALEPSEDEESITSTAITPTVADMTALTTHYSDLTLDRLPLRRAPHALGTITTGTWRGGYAVVDDIYSFQTFVDPFDTMEQLTFLRAGLPVEYSEAGPLAVARTRSGGERLSLSLRNTITSSNWVAGPPRDPDGGTHHLTELEAGGRLIPDRLWFFGAVWQGGEVFRGDRRGVLAKLTGRIGAQHSLSALYNVAETTSQQSGRVDTTEGTLRYSGVAGPRFTVEVVADHAEIDPFADANGLFARSTYVIGTPAGDHVLSAGGHLFESGPYEQNSVFVNDRWSIRRLTVNAGVRHERRNTSPRAGAVFDLLGNGRHAIVANVGDYYRGPYDDTRELTLGYALVIGNTGSARVDLVRRTRGGRPADGAQLDFHYSLFDRFQTGANYTWIRHPERIGNLPEHHGNAWFTLEIPFDTHELAVTVLERFHEFNGRDLMTDIGARYTLPVGSTALTGAIDVVNAFDVEDAVSRRELRAWLRFRL